MLYRAFPRMLLGVPMGLLMLSLPVTAGAQTQADGEAIPMLNGTESSEEILRLASKPKAQLPPGLADVDLGQAHSMAPIGNVGKPPAQPGVTPVAAEKAECSATAFSTILVFATKITALNDDQRRFAQDLAKAMQSPGWRNCRWVLEGHADSRGPADANMILSERRAAGVVEVLAAAGVPKEHMTVKAMGETRQAFPDDPTRTENRRVVFRPQSPETSS